MKKEVTIAITACVAVVILFFGLNFLKGMTIFSSDNSYYVRFHDIQGLSKANPIYADGYKVGVVKDIYYDYAGNGDVIVKFDVDNNLRIPKGSTAEVGSDLMGNVKMNLLMANNPRERVNPGDTIQGATNSGLMGRVAQILPTVEALVPKIDSILTSVNALLADPALAATLHNAQQITSNLTTTSQQLNVLMANLNKSVPGMLNKADATLANTQKLTNNLAAVDIQTTMNEVNSTISNLKTFTDNLNNGKGSLGLLMNDPGLYNNLNSTMISADSLLIDLKAHPKRYVHFSFPDPQWSLHPLRLLPVGQWVFDKSPPFPGDRNPKGEGSTNYLKYGLMKKSEYSEKSEYSFFCFNCSFIIARRATNFTFLSYFLASY